MATTRPHPTPLLAVAALSAATAIALTRVFAHAQWLVPALVAALAPVAITWFAVAYRWSARTAILVIAYGGAWWSAIVVHPDRTIAHVIPTLPGLGVWLRGVLDTPHVLRTAVVPVPPVGNALQLALGALWLSAAGAAWSAAKHDGVLAAMLPDFAMFIAIAALGKGPYLATTTLWCVAAVGFLLAEHATATFRSRTAFQTTGTRRSRLVTGGAFAAVAAVMFGAVVGPRLPEAESAPLINYKHFGNGNQNTQIVDISPLVGIGDKLRQPRATALFTVTASAPARWRLMALDDFDGAFWGLHNTTTASTLTPGIDHPGANGALHTLVTQTYAIGPMSGKFLPAAYQAVRNSGITNLVVIPDSATLVVPDENHQGLHYDVTSNLVGASPDTLRALPEVTPTDDAIIENLALPARLSPLVRAEAQRVVRGATNEYDKARLLQDYFRDPARFRYDQAVDLSESSDAMVTFLFHERRGFCEQFAGTFAAMARAVGLPTRVAVGFQRGTLTSSSPDHSTYTVTTKDAHAWPEVYFPRIGWVGFEPTPQRYDYDSPGDPSGTKANAPPYAGGGGQPGTATTTSTPTTGGTKTTSVSPPKHLPNLEVTPPRSGRTTSANQRSGAAWLLVTGIVLGALAAAVGGIAGVQFARRWRRSHASSARARVSGAWTQATEELARRDIRRRPSATAVEFAMREAPAAGAGAAGPARLELAQLQTAARYAIEDPADADADRAWECADAIGEALRAATPRRERIRQRFGLTRRSPRGGAPHTGGQSSSGRLNPRGSTA